jgi:Kef-type K+ transport system membrane component KefB
LNLLGQVGLVLYMFLVGLELDRSLLRGRGIQISVVAVAVVGVPVLLGFGVAALLTGDVWVPDGVDSTTFALFLGAGLSVTAFPVMARILQEKSLMATSLGAVGVGSAAVVTVLMFLMIAAASAAAKGSGVIGAVAVKVLLALGLLVFLATAGRALLGVVVARYEERTAETTIGIMLMVALAVALAADRIGISALVGGFLAGVAFPARPEMSETAIKRLQPAVVLFLLPVFLAVSGLRTDLRLLEPSLIPGLALFLACMILGKWGAGWVAARSVGLTNAESHVLGVLLNCRGLLILVVGLIGLQLGVIGGTMQAVFVVGAIVTTIMTGPLVDVFMPRDLTAEREPAPPPAIHSIH